MPTCGHSCFMRCRSRWSCAECPSSNSSPGSQSREKLVIMADVDRMLGGYDPNAGHSAHAATRPKHIPVPSLLRALLSEHLDPGYAAAAAKRDHSASPQSGRARAFGWFWQALAATLVATVFAAAVAQARSVEPGVRAAQELLASNV